MWDAFSARLFVHRHLLCDKDRKDATLGLIPMLHLPRQHPFNLQSHSQPPPIPALLLAGFTHLQQAQTVRWGHWLMSHAAAWQRDDMRLRDLLPRVATLPLGSGALAGNPFLVDRQFIARELGMVGGVCPNSMDAVSDRECPAHSYR
jgi:hypothetical protein